MTDPYRNKWRILVAVMLGTLGSGVSASMLTISLPSIADYFQVDISIAQWLPATFRLIIVSFILTYGRLGDILGHRRLFLWGLGGFIIASFLGGLSQSIGMLIGFRGLQAIAAGMKMAVSHAIITAAFPPAERGRAFGLYLSSIAFSTTLGPSLGGVATEYLGWQSIFFVVVLIGIPAFFWANRVLPQEKTSPGQRFDPAGAVSLSLFLLSLLLLINRGHYWGWNSVPCLSLMSSALVFGCAFFWIETHVPQPLIRLGLFSNLTFSFSNLAAFLNYMAHHIAYFLTPFYLQMVLQRSPSSLGLTMTALPIMTMVVAPLSGTLSDRIGTKPLRFAGPALCALALLLMSRLTAHSSLADVAWRLAVLGLGGSVFSPPNNSAIMGAVPRSDLGVASGMLNVNRNMGWLMGVVVGAAIIYSRLPTYEAFHQVGPLLASFQSAYLVGAILAALAAIVPFVSRTKSS